MKHFLRHGVAIAERRFLFLAFSAGQVPCLPQRPACSQ
jgi:hypothetical protein